MTAERENQIHAYLSADPGAAEAEEFERAMEADEGLRRDVEDCRETLEAARQWLESEAPGIERVEGLEIPRAIPRGAAPRRPRRRTARIVSLRPVLARMTAAAAIFVGGIFVGAWMPRGASPTQTDVFEPAEQREVTIEASWRPSRPVYPPSSFQIPRRKEKVRHAVARVRTTEDEYGRVTIENVSESSGTQSIWVVDGSFQIGNS